MVFTELFVSAFITLFVVIDPPGCAPIYAGLTKEASNAQARAMAFKATVIAAIILLIFAFSARGCLARYIFSSTVSGSLVG